MSPITSADFVTVCHPADVVEAEILEQLLQHQGIQCRSYKPHGPTFGGAQHIFEFRIEVPAAQADEAWGVIDAFNRAANAEQGSKRSRRNRRRAVGWSS